MTPSARPRSSSTSAGVVWLDREERIAALREAARRAASRVPAIRRVILFGSLATGSAGPRSDADLLVELSGSDLAPRDRVPDLLAAFSPLPCPLDLFPFTTDEMREHPDAPVVRTARAEGMDLLA